MSGGSLADGPKPVPGGGSTTAPGGATAPGGGTARWPSVADFALPAGLACAQLVGTYLLTTGLDRPLGTVQWRVVVVAVIGSCLALIWRRVAPVPVLAATIALSAAGLLTVQSTETLVAGLADALALYSLAVQRGRRAATAGCAAALAVASASVLPIDQTLSEQLVNQAINIAFYIAITALGQLRREHKVRRRRLAERLAGAERERRAVAESERERLARDLHDVAGHHLSAVVVHSGAVARMSDPELTEQALTAAADTGREVLEALGRLVDVMSPGSEDGELESTLPALCEGLARVGIPVSLAVEGTPPASRGTPLTLLRKARTGGSEAALGPRAGGLRPQLSTAAFRIVQESLTNAMRYASGAPVAVELRYVPGAVEITVANEAPTGEGPASQLGTGRGIAGMRDRAEALGGTLTAGPDGSGGWSVGAVLPTAPGGARRGPGWTEVLDVAVIAICVVIPALLAFSPPEPILRGASAGQAALAVALLAVRAAPLWWRRRFPYLALGAVVLIDVVWVTTAGVRSAAAIGLVAAGGMAEMIAVYSVAGHARPGRPTWPAPFIAAIGWAAMWTMVLFHDDDTAHDPPLVPFGLISGMLFAVLVLLPFWAWGRTVTGRGQRWETSARETMATRAGEAVLAERHRVALGLSGTVQERTARLIRVAEAGRAGQVDPREALGGVTEEARAALIDMRALLDSLEED